MDDAFRRPAENRRRCLAGGVARSFEELDEAGRRFWSDAPLAAKLEAARQGGRAAGQLGAPPEVVRGAALLAEDEFMFFGTPPARIDLLRTIPGVDFAAAWQRHVKVEGEGVTLHVIGRDDLIAAKRAWR